MILNGINTASTVPPFFDLIPCQENQIRPNLTQSRIAPYGSKKLLYDVISDMTLVSYFQILFIAFQVILHNLLALDICHVLVNATCI